MCLCVGLVDFRFGLDEGGGTGGVLVWGGGGGGGGAYKSRDLY